MSELLEKCTLAKDAGYKMVSVSTVTKDNALEAIANALVPMKLLRQTTLT